MKLMPGADQAGLGSMAGKPGWITVFSALLIALVISGLALNVTPVWMPLVLLASAFLSVGLIGAIARVKLKGINGDTLGGMEQGAEIFCLLAFLSVIGP
jgi:cobalamin synthase